MPAKNISRMRRRLLRWYDTNRRDLPWRRTSDPYAIWIAETMLQQTQVKTVLPYYDRFIKTLPTVEALHRAPLGKVLALWSGLGYYRRAENLKRAAREILRQYKGEIPASYDSLRSLPGIGNYTAGAVMSIAFQRPFPAVDGNARRVLDRVFRVKTGTELRQIARQIVPRARPGDFNQAMMELGATICLPQNPHCPRCPLAADCAGRMPISGPPPLSKPRCADRRSGRWTVAPRGGPERSSRHSRSSRSPARDDGPSRLRKVDWPLAVIHGRGKVLLRRRAAQGILPGLWEFPGGERRKQESLGAALRRQLRELNGGVKPQRLIGAFRHSITNRRIFSPVFLFSVASRATLRPPNRQWRWLTPASLDRYAISAMTRKAMGLFQAHDKNSF